MIKIGDFSKLSRISVRMLRHYNEIGLLIPDSIDDFTGYRYYSETQLLLANRIGALKNMGFSLAAITEILKEYDNPEILKRFLLLKYAEIKEQAEKAAPCNTVAVFFDEGYKDSDIDVEIQLSVDGSYHDTKNVVFKTVAPIQIVSVTFKGGYEQLSAINESIANWVVDNHCDFDGAMFNIYHVSPAMEKDPENWITEVCYPIRKK